MRVLISGSGGFISKNIIQFLLEKKNIKIHAISRKKKRNKKNLIFYNLNLLNKKEVKKMIRREKNQFFDIILHTASITANEKNLNDFNTLKKNFRITCNFIEILRSLKFKKIINFSSSSVYPNVSGRYNEESEIEPHQNNDFLYGLSKIFSETLLNSYFKKQTVLNLRISQVYGQGMLKKRIIPNMINSVKNDNKILIYGDGSRVLNLIEINQLINYLFKLIKKNSFGVYNVSSSKISTKNLALRILEKYGNKKTKLVFIKKRQNNNKFYLDTKKMDTMLHITKKEKKILL